MSKLRTLTVRLLREGRSPEAAFTERFAPGAERALERRPWDAIEGAELFVGQIYTNAPSWIPFLSEGSADLPESLRTGGAGAVLFLPHQRRTLAICFGHIHIALNDDCFERQFGLKVTLNTVPRARLRTLDTATPDAVTFLKRVHASKDSDLSEFGVDVLRDIARVAGGTPSDPQFARFVAGKDTLSITCSVNIETLEQKCSEILAAYDKTDYRKDYSWIDNLRVVHEKDLLDELEEKLLEALLDLRSGSNADLHLSPPEIVDYTDGAPLHYNGFGSSGSTFHSLSIHDYVSELERCSFKGTVEDIRTRHRIRAKKQGEDVYSQKWRVYECFVFETAIGSGNSQEHFVLFAGNWYRVHKSFKDRIEAFFSALSTVEIIGPTVCRNESELIEDLKATRSDLLVLDKVPVIPKGVLHANLEACDFFSRDRQFIHLKDGHSSGPISHLWNQGVVSAEAFVADRVFRGTLRQKVKARERGFEELLPRGNESFDRRDFTVVFGVMRKPYKDGTVGLPFFSKVSLQVASERIQQLGFSLALELIPKPSSDSPT